MVRQREEIHQCQILTQDSMSFLPKLGPHANIIDVLKRKFKKCTLISETHPQSIEYYRSDAEILRIRKLHVEANCYLIHPFSVFRAYYDIYLLFVIFVILIYFPMAATFNLDNMGEPIFIKDAKPHGCRVMDILTTLLLTLDIVLTFFTGYTIKDKGIVVMNAKKIAKHYIYGYFFIDVAAAIPEPFVNVTFKEQRMFSLLSLVKIFRIHSFFESLTRTGEFLRISNFKIQTISTLLMTIILFHWLACSQYFIPQIRLMLFGEYDKGSWIVQNDEHIHVWNLYVHCFYRASGYIFAVNFERTPARVWEEKMLAIITYFVGRICVAYCTVMIMQQLLDKRALRSKYEEIITQIKSYMSQQCLPMHMQTRILQFYRYKYSCKYFKEGGIYALLSEALKAEVNLNSCNKLLKSVALLSQLPRQTLQQVVNNLQIEIYLPNDMIIKAGSVGDCMYFLSSGTVAVWTPSGKEVCHLQDGAYFGEIALIFKDKRRTANIIAIEICEIYKLSRKGFKSCFSGNSALLMSLEETAKERLEITEMYEAAMKKAYMEQNYG